MPTNPRKPMYDWQIKPKRARYGKEHRCIDCGVDSTTYRCETCRSKRAAYAIQWRQKNHDRVITQQKKWRDNNRDKIKYQNKKSGARLYDMTIEEYENALRLPCGICGSLEKKRGIDHCHTTNKIRGVLCLSCNSKLGWFEKFKPEVFNWISNGGKR